ncbi:protease HtpX [Thiohalocapsa marina]|uniref:Protease HtpX n=1 Tax=Thiohalocapsa marina TaxID=424902 RepID=A0A5M8FRE6_9GAMM|nr:protease HtpX [Thiohalocapsa marina]KAA6186726.1 protease HtpX [Thiohalocapsa marina]
MLRVLLYVGTNFAILAVLFVVLNILGIGDTTQGTGLLVMAVLFGFGGSLISLFISKWMAKRSMGVQIIQQPTTQFEQWLFEIVQRQSERAGIRMPEVGIFESPEPNAFATGWNRNDALVAVSTGLLQHMTKDEVEAVVGHEISHVANGDMVTLALIQGVLNTFVIILARVIGGFVDSALRGQNDEGGPGIGYFVVSIIAEIVLGFLASIVVMWFSRYREFRADAGGADLAGRQKMIDALRALQRVHQPHDLPAGEFAAFGISGGIGDGIKKLFASHPPLEERIAALESGRR